MSSLEPTPSRVAPRGRDPARGVYYKLAFFSVALFAAPISAYYFAKDRYLDGNATYAGGLAAVVVNIVLAAYIVAAFLEDDSEPKAQPKPDAKKDQ
ncbi:uncharacterized protein PAN0_005c2767 [Moesziomyces antarcticus]|uniref:Related to VMA21 - ATPase assembly integral membrane protein n=2 Tax=Pseudozyma antarctica TaxID=84753 RepID=A0A5C3FKP5_PSEA2|nr:uncharacterized protein PAN0_005c2767 [Moesziomyces antarcticus]GAK64553.1 conserved hypothetical protein [Moesziomyces antarcticus]SPO44938.1 related to VMA21 - ATPase assembly integral membrane protein [Moesziomyces antarcticus]